MLLYLILICYSERIKVYKMQHPATTGKIIPCATGRMHFVVTTCPCTMPPRQELQKRHLHSKQDKHMGLGYGGYGVSFL